MGDDIEINVTETTNIIEITPQPNDQIVDIAVTDNAPNVEINVTPSVVEINVTRGSSTAIWGAITGNLTDQTDLVTALGLKADLVGGKVPSSQLPSYVDDVVEVADYAALPTSGETGKIYVTLDNNKIYRWSGSVYIEIAANNAIWGAITGTLSNQTDLVNALNLRVPYTGATSNVNLGEYGLNSGFLQLDTTPTNTPTTIGTIYWDAANRTAALIDGDGDTTLQIGQEQRILVHNNTGSTLTDGQVVYVTGSTGNLPSVSLADATSETTSAATVGVITESIANGADGFITTSGIVNGLNTLAFNEGDLLWLGTTPGAFTNVKPASPAHLVLIGYVIKKAGGNGSILVKIQNTQELSESSDVLFTSLTDKDILTYESSSQLWKNKSISTILGYTPANDASVVKLTGDQTITGTKTFGPIVASTLKVLTFGAGMVYSDSVGSVGTMNGTANSLTYWSSASMIGSLSTATYPNLTELSYIKGVTSAIQTQLDSKISGSGTTNYLPKFTGSTALGNSVIYDDGTNIAIGTTTALTGGGTGKWITLQGTAAYSGGIIGSINGVAKMYVYSESGFAKLQGASGEGVRLDVNGGTAALTALSGGNVGIGTTSPSYKLDVAGVGRFLGSTPLTLERSGSTKYTFSLGASDDFYINNVNIGTTPLTILSSGNVGIGTTSPSAKLHVEGLSYFGSDMFTAQNGGIFFDGNSSYGSGIFGRNFGDDLAMNAGGLERIRITSSGNVGIGTTSPNSNTNRTTLTLNNSAWGGQLDINVGGTNHAQFGTDNFNSGLSCRIQSQDGIVFNAGGGSERMRITSGGNVLIGTSSSIGSGIFQVKTSSANNVAHFQNGTSDAGYGLVFLNVAGSAVGSIGWTNVMTSYNITSDYRLKEDFKDYSGLDLISKIKTYDYKWKESEDRMFGVKAHELQEVVPYAVTGEKDAEQMQSVDYSKLVPILVQAIQELQEKINKLENK